MSNELGNTPADKNYKPSGTTKAQEAALKAFPGQPFIHDRCVFRMGYEQAEKDLALTWEDVQLLYIITGKYESEINKNLEGFPSSSQEMFEEILRRFKEGKR